MTKQTTSESTARHNCGRRGWERCCACSGRLHLAGCTTTKRPAIDCCQERHERLIAQGHQYGLDDAAVEMQGSWWSATAETTPLELELELA